VSQRSRFDDIRVQASQVLYFRSAYSEQAFGHSPAELGHFQGVCQPVMEDISLASRRHLRDPAKPPEFR